MFLAVTSSLKRILRGRLPFGDAFFAGGPQPQIAITVYPPVLSVLTGTGVTAKFETAGQNVTTQAGQQVQNVQTQVNQVVDQVIGGPQTGQDGSVVGQTVQQAQGTAGSVLGH